MTCSRCGNIMYLDGHSDVEAWSCLICGHRVYPRLNVNAFCQRCDKGFHKHGRAELCPDCRTVAKTKKTLPAQKCKACWCEYVPRRRGGKFCSNGCAVRDAYYRKRPKKHCELCGDPIEGRGSKYCSAECRMVKWRAENADRIKAHARAYYENNKDEHNDRALKRYHENRDLRLEQNKEWARKNSKSRREYQREYRRKNLERIRTQDRERAQRRKEASRA